jgi:peroxiredoxin
MLHNGDVFPSLTFPCAGGGEISIPGDLAGAFGVVLFFRGSWSDLCVEQLEAFSRSADRLGKEGIKIVSVSVDDRETSQALVERYQLAFPLAYAADPRAVTAVTGIPVNEDNAHFEATGFIINPESRIETAVYSTYDGPEDRIVTTISSRGPISRLAPDDVLHLVRHAKSFANR